MWTTSVVLSLVYGVLVMPWIADGAVGNLTCPTTEAWYSAMATGNKGELDGQN